MSVMTYIHEHPWATGTIVVVGGIIFILIVRGGSSSAAATTTGPSAAQLQADATVQAAQIAANAQGAQAGAAVQAAQIGAGVQMNSDNMAAQVALAQTSATQEIYDRYLTDQTNIVQGQQSVAKQAITSASSWGPNAPTYAPQILETAITGQPSALYNPNNQNITVNTTSGSNGNSAASSIVGSIAGAVGSIFSDMRLKENIRHLGYDSKGRDVYSFNYKGSNKTRIGYMAQSLARSEPETVSVDPVTGYYRISA